MRNENQNDYETDGVPGAGKVLSDNTYWIKASGIRIGKVSWSPMGYQVKCIGEKTFGSHIYTHWQIL